MRRSMRRLATALAVVLAAGLVHAAPPAKAPTSAPAQEAMMSLNQQIQNLMLEREAALRQLNTEYQSAALADRRALEEHGAQLQEEYERQYLGLVIQYCQLSGDTEELDRAQRMLEAMSAQPAPRPQLNLDRNIAPSPATESEAKEGGVIRE